jgi:hypothetical protein
VTDIEAAPQEEPDTPEEEVLATFPVLVDIAEEIAEVRRKQNDLEKREKDLREEILEKWTQMPNLHGIRLKNGDAVRRTWSVRTTQKPDPARLRELMADASNYIVELVDLPALKKDYPTVWEQAGRVKRTQTITVRLKGETPKPGTSD